VFLVRCIPRQERPAGHTHIIPR